MNKLLPLITLFFVLLLSSTAYCAQVQINVAYIYPEDNLIRIEGRVNNPVEGQQLVVMGYRLEEGQTSEIVYMDNIPASLDEDNIFLLDLNMGDNINISNDFMYEIRIGGTMVDNPAVATLVFNYPVEGVLLGDANDDGIVGAKDSAFVIQYVLDHSSVPTTEKQLIAMKVSEFPAIGARDAVLILQKTLDSSFIFPIERLQ